jgi:hypothetical protein
MLELKVVIVQINGSVESFSMEADNAIIQGCVDCARLCPNGCKFWEVSATVFCVVYIHGGVS